MWDVKSLWNSFKIAFAMFSKIPMPQADWSEENMRYMLCFFPFVGAAVGAIMLAAEWICRYLGMSDGFITAVLVLIPIFVTGGIHVDGLLDTSDALSSWRDREKRLEILKDSHAGAFAVITACVYFGTVAEFSRKAKDLRVRNTLVIYLLLLTVCMICIQPVWGAAVILTALLVFAFYRHKALKYFGGTTGDLSGYFLCLCEVWIVLVLAVVSVNF